MVDNKVTITADTTVTAAFTQNAYTLTVVSDHASVTKSPDQETYTYGQEVTLTMGTVADGWTFTGWSSNVVDNKVTITADTTVTAAFTQNAYTLTVVSDHGSVTAAPVGPYAYNQTVTLTMGTVENGYTFTGWSGGGCTGTDPCTLTITADTTVTAAFTQNAYTLTVVSDHAPVTKSPDQETYTYGQEVTLTMGTVADGWTFTGWSSNVVDNKVTITADTTVTAAFTQNTYTLTVVSDHGSVTAAPVGPYAYNQTVTLTMGTVENGYTFTGWSGGGCTGTDPCTLTITADTTVTAAFTQNAYTLTVVSDHAPVTKSPDQETYTYGQEVTLTMGTVADGWTFTGWSSNVVDNKVTITADTTVTANFTQDTYTLTVDITGSGTVSKDPDQASYHLGEEVTLTAAPAAGWTFTGWTGDLSGTTNPATIAMDGSKTVGATFTPNLVTLTITPPVGGTITADPDGPYHYGDEVTLTATADTGYTFTAWTGDCAEATGSTCALTLDDDNTVGATFTQIEYTLTVTAETGGSASKTPDQASYHLGDVVTLTATAFPGYTFSGWTGDFTGTTNQVEITVSGSMAVTATFTQDQYTLAVTVNGSGTVSKDPDQASYLYDETVTLAATPAAGWTFAGWSGAGCSGTGACQVSMDGNKTVTATFTQDQYSLTVDIDPAGSGTVARNNPGPYNYGDVVTLTPAPAAGYIFSGWTGEVTENKVTITGNMVVTANFSLIEYTLTTTATPAEGGSISIDQTEPYYLRRHRHPDGDPVGWLELRRMER